MRRERLGAEFKLMALPRAQKPSFFQDMVQAHPVFCHKEGAAVRGAAAAPLGAAGEWQGPLAALKANVKGVDMPTPWRADDAGWTRTTNCACRLRGEAAAGNVFGAIDNAFGAGATG